MTDWNRDREKAADRAEVIQGDVPDPRIEYGCASCDQYHEGTGEGVTDCPNAPDEGTAYHNGKHDPAKGEGCERVEVTAPLWLTIHDEGGITVYGISRDDVKVYCGNDHDIELTEAQDEALGDYLATLEREVGAESPA